MERECIKLPYLREKNCVKDTDFSVSAGDDIT